MNCEIILYVSDQSFSKDFYRKTLQLEPVLDVPGITEFEINPLCKLGLMPENGMARIIAEKAPHPATGNGIPRCELYLSVEDVDSYYQRAIKHGGKEISTKQERDWGDTVAYVADRDGHIIAFAEKIS